MLAGILRRGGQAKQRHRYEHQEYSSLNHQLFLRINLSGQSKL
jgi:hypothetical protein